MVCLNGLKQMVEVFDCPVISKINNKKFKNKLIEYTLENKCCSIYPTCNHPAIQSDTKADETFSCIRKSINNLFTNYLETKNFNFYKKNVWIYYAPKNTNTKNVKHNHYFSGIANTQISALMYITPTDLGTNFYDFKIKPKINKWYVWHSGLFHEPEDGITQEDRLVIALSSVIA